MIEHVPRCLKHFSWVGTGDRWNVLQQIKWLGGHLWKNIVVTFYRDGLLCDVKMKLALCTDKLALLFSVRKGHARRPRRWRSAVLGSGDSWGFKWRSCRWDCRHDDCSSNFGQTRGWWVALLFEPVVTNVVGLLVEIETLHQYRRI